MQESDSVVLITGAARRIGAGVARALHEDGWRIVLHQRQPSEAGSALMAELNEARPDSVHGVYLNLDDTDALAGLAKDASTRWGRLDALINNASSYYPTPIQSLRPNQFDDLMASNFKAPLFLTQACLPHFADDAMVINVLDALARQARPGYAVYNAAKAALWALTETLASELAPSVRVNGVAPGHIMWAENGDLDDEQKQNELARIPLGRMGQPTDIAGAVRFLLSPAASYLNGVVLPVDGGLRLR